MPLASCSVFCTICTARCASNLHVPVVRPTSRGPGSNVSKWEMGVWGGGLRLQQHLLESPNPKHTRESLRGWDSHRGVFLMLQDPTATSLHRSTCWTRVDWTQLASNLPLVESDLVTWLVRGWQCPARFWQQSWWGTRFQQQSWWGMLLRR